MDIVFYLLTSSKAAWVFSGLIILIALAFYISFRRRMMPVVAGLEQAISGISQIKGHDGFATVFDEFDERTRNNPILHHAWVEFSETLIQDPALEPLGVRHTRTTSEFFHRNSIVGDRANLRFYGAVPNLLTGMGILGTFIGLVAGIYLASNGLGAADTDVVKGALQRLLNGASLAFMTSIAGLSTSMLFSWREKHALHQLDARIRQWNDALEARLLRVTAESLAVSQLAQSREQTVILGQFTSDLAFQIADAFQDRISASLGPAMERLVVAVEEMRIDQGRRNDDALKGMLEKFSESLSGSAGRELATLGETLANLNTKLEAQIAALGERQDQLNTASSKSIEELTKVFQWSLEQTKNGVREALSEIEKTIGGLVAEISTVIAGATTLSKEFDEILGNTRSVVGELNEAASTVSAAAAPMVQSVADIREAASEIKIVAETNGQTATLIGQSVNNIATLQAEMKDSWARYEERFEQVDASLANVMRELVTGLDAYTERVKGFITGLDKHTSSIVQDLAGASSELSSAVEELSASLGRAAA